MKAVSTSCLTGSPAKSQSMTLVQIKGSVPIRPQLLGAALTQWHALLPTLCQRQQQATPSPETPDSSISKKQQQRWERLHSLSDITRCSSLSTSMTGTALQLLLLLWMRSGCAAAVSTTGPSPCLAPAQWEGRAVQYDHSTGRNTRAAVSYDASQQRVRVLEEKKGLVPCKRFFEYIYLYQETVMFQIEQVTKFCSKLPLNEPWDPYDIPDNSTYEDQYYIGGPEDQIFVQEWSDRKPARKYETWVGVYTLKDCYPVQETYTRNYSVTTSTRFFDIQLGISDPSVFTPPASCQVAEPIRMKEDC
ncbi:mammalian ependymin-related protein 1 [Microcaecilia unicolor]|uniref:Mammalian ependymin-related protein 1 n=1 Tax=Microcaecilia unicolor TaxID=1415580 RepID=A0A6P7YFD3_9AMPH|nr:mammalian ependymin-related protein 1 [Microcaecilia unicolor]